MHGTGWHGDYERLHCQPNCLPPPPLHPHQDRHFQAGFEVLQSAIRLSQLMYALQGSGHVQARAPSVRPGTTVRLRLTPCCNWTCPSGNHNRHTCRGGVIWHTCSPSCRLLAIVEAQAPQWIHCDEAGNVKLVPADRQRLVQELNVRSAPPPLPPKYIWLRHLWRPCKQFDLCPGLAQLVLSTSVQGHICCGAGPLPRSQVGPVSDPAHCPLLPLHKALRCNASLQDGS